MAFQLEAMLIERNGGIGGGGKQWINLGVVPEIDPNRNLWIAIPAAPGAIAGGSGRAGGDSSFVGASGQAPGVASCGGGGSASGGGHGGAGGGSG
mgnify:CR=1 FL=1